MLLTSVAGNHVLTSRLRKCALHAGGAPLRYETGTAAGSAWEACAATTMQSIAESTMRTKTGMHCPRHIAACLRSLSAQFLQQRIMFHQEASNLVNKHWAGVVQLLHVDPAGMIRQKFTTTMQAQARARNSQRHARCETLENKDFVKAKLRGASLCLGSSARSLEGCLFSTMWRVRPRVGPGKRTPSPWSACHMGPPRLLIDHRSAS